MANAGLLGILRNGAQAWNEWRRGNQELLADLKGADIKGVDLSEADLREASLARADLSEANLVGADLRGAELWKANLRRANLSEASLVGADLKGADLKGADLRGANLREAILSQADADHLIRKYGSENLADIIVVGDEPDTSSSQGINFLIDPGAASPEFIADILSDISLIYKLQGGSGLRFTPEEIRLREREFA